MTALFRWLARFKGPIMAIAGFGAVLSGLVGYYTTYKTVTAPATATAPAPTADATHPLSIMVLPFANQTGDAARAYIADGMTSSITADLSRIRDAMVLPVATALSFQDKKLGVKELGRAAHVRFVLSGSVRASGDTLRVDAQLADTASGAQLWSESFEGQAGNLFALQDQVTARIGNSIGSDMVIVAARDSAKRRDSPKVADLLLQVQALNLRPPTLALSQQAEQMLRQVLVLEPRHPGATALLASNLSARFMHFHDKLGEPELAQLAQEADTLAMQAQALDPANPAVYAPLSFALGRKGDRTGARKALEKLVELDPKNPDSYNQLGLMLTAEDPQRAVDVLKQGLALQDPRQPTLLFVNLAMAYFELGDYRQAIDYAIRCQQNNPQFSYCLEPKAWSYAMLGDAPQAQRAAVELLRVDPGYRTSKAVLPPLFPTPADLAAHARHLKAAKLAGLPE